MYKPSHTFAHILGKIPMAYDEHAQLPIEIPHASRYDLAKWLRELHFVKGVEVGVAAGDYSRVLCELNPQMELWGVDPWMSYDGYTDFPQEKLNGFYEEARGRLRSFRKRYHFVRKLSAEAAADFEDASLDFVYIDSNHTDPFITEDLTLWSAKVRKGGIVAGHDYIKRVRDPWVVKDAVNAFVKMHAIKTLCVLGLTEVKEGLVRENTRSWMWVVE